VGGRGIELKARVIYKQVTLKARLNGKAVGRTEMDNTQRMPGLLCCLERDQLQFLNILIGNKVAKLRSVDQLHFLLIAILKLIRRLGAASGPHFTQPSSTTSTSLFFIASIVYF